jgi:hypothetical protein
MVRASDPKKARELGKVARHPSDGGALASALFAV